MRSLWRGSPEIMRPSPKLRPQMEDSKERISRERSFFESADRQPRCADAMRARGQANRCISPGPAPSRVATVAAIATDASRLRSGYGPG